MQGGEVRSGRELSEPAAGTLVYPTFLSENIKVSGPLAQLRGLCPPKLPSLLESRREESTKALSTMVAGSALPVNGGSAVRWPLNFPVITEEGILL